MLIFGSPRRYVQGPDALRQIGAEVGRIGTSALLLADAHVNDIVGATARRSCAEAGVTLLDERFGGEITHAEIDRIAQAWTGRGIEIVIAAGGGKTIDTGKAVAHRLGARIVTVPTVASNDSPTSHIGVIYDAAHKLIGVEKFAGNPELVLVDTAIIARAPSILFSAGIGDALVKKFEVGQCVAAGGVNVFGGTSPLTALALANACYDILRADAVAALAAVGRGMADPALERVVEATVLMSGLAFESGGLSIAHAMTRGLSAVHGPAQALHGLQVAYGLLVQLQLEGRSRDFMADMRGFHRQTRLPVSLRDIGFDGGDAGIRTIAELTNAAPHVKHFARALSPDDIVSAIRAVEEDAGA